MYEASSRKATPMIRKRATPGEGDRASSDGGGEHQHAADDVPGQGGVLQPQRTAT